MATGIGGRRRIDYRYWVLAASALTMLVGTGSIHLVVVALKPIAAEFGWPRAVPSAAFALQYFGGGVGGIVMGLWLDRSGMGGPAMLGATMIGLGAILTSGISSEWQLYFVFGIMMGVCGRGTMNAPLMANIGTWFDHRRGMAVGIVFGGQAIGGVLWPPLLQHFNESIGWRDTAFWYGFLALVVMLPLALVLNRRAPAPLPSERPAEQALPDELWQAGGPRVPSAVLPTARLQVALCCAIVGCCIPMSIPMAHIVAHATDLGYSESRGAELLAVILLAASASSFFGIGFMADRYGGLRTLFVFSAIQAVMLALLAAMDTLVGLYIGAALFGLGYGGILPSYPIIVREYMPRLQTGRRTGIVLLFSGVGMAIGGWLAGYVYDTVGSYLPAFALGVGFNLVNLAIIGTLISKTKTRYAA